MTFDAARQSPLLYLAVVAYCLGLAWRAAHAHFAPDDPMNMYWYWHDGFWRVLWHNLTFWSTAYRPLGGLYYLPIYAAFGLNPVPYRIMILGIVLANAYLSCRTAELLTGSRAVALLTGVLAGAHASLLVIYYSNSSVFDILAYFLSMLILIRYITIRQRNLIPSAGQAAIIIVLFVLALDAKEMSVVTAGFVLAYEILFHGAPWNAPRMMGWLKREGRLPMILIVLVVIYTAGKLLGPHPITDAADYKIHLSGKLYVSDNLHYLNDLFYTRVFDSGIKLLIVNSILILALALLRKTAALRWACFYVLTATLPISIISIHGNNCLYIPLFGWALLVSIVSVKIIDTISPTVTWPRFELPRSAVRNGLVAVAVCAFALGTVIKWRHRPAFFMRSQQPTWSMIQQLEALPFRPGANRSVLILKDPLDSYESLELSDLIWNDHSVEVHMARDYAAGPTAEQIAAYDSVLTYENGEFKVVRDGRAR